MKVETRDVTIRRLRMRSMRRGIKEMDLILSDFAARNLDALPDEALSRYDALLHENDHDIYAWVLGTAEAPTRYADLLVPIRAGAIGLTAPR